MTLKGQIFRKWDFVIAGIYEGKTKGTDTAQLFFHWDYLNEEIRKRGISRDKEAVGFLSWKLMILIKWEILLSLLTMSLLILQKRLVQRPKRLSNLDLWQ